MSSPVPQDRMARLSTALKNAHTAGDTAAAQRFAAEILRLRGEGGGGGGPQQSALLSATGQGRQTDLYATPGPVRRAPSPDPRDLGRESAEEMGPIRGRVNAAGQGVGSGLFGVGTPLTAAEAMITSRLRGDTEPMEWDDALEYARGRREALAEEHPGAYWTGIGASMVGGLKAGATVASKLPTVVRKIATPSRAAEGAGRLARTGNAAANVARISGAGAGGAGVIAGMEEGMDAVPWAAATGGVLGPVAGPVLRGGGKLAGAVKGRFGDGAALKTIAKRMHMPVEQIESALARAREVFPDRAPRVADVVNDQSAEDLALIGHSYVGAKAGNVFREAAEQGGAARQVDVPEAIRRGGPTTTVKDETLRLGPIRDEAAVPYGPGENIGARRMQATKESTLRYRDQAMDKVMDKVGDHEIPLTADMLDAVLHNEIQGALPPILRSRIVEALERGGDVDAITMPVRIWEQIRYALSQKAGPGAGQEYSILRNKVRNYVGERVPEYADALEEFGRRSRAATAVAAGGGALTENSRVFRETLTDMTPEQRRSARGGARTNLAHQFDDPERADRFMGRLTRDRGLQANLRRILDDREWEQLEDLAQQYGHQLRVVEGARVGASGIGTRGTDSRFAAEAQGARATPEGGSAFSSGSRGALADAAGESPEAAAAVAENMHRTAGLQNRITTALGGDEAARLREVGTIADQSRRNLETLTPSSNEAQARVAQQSRDVQTAIGTLVIFGTGRSSAAMQASNFATIAQRLRMSRGTAKRAAELLVDPEQAPKIISYLKTRGVSNDDIHKMYMRAAAGAGVLTGVATGAGGGGR